MAGLKVITFIWTAKEEKTYNSASVLHSDRRRTVMKPETGQVINWDKMEGEK